jgi:membrane protease YdiL (CAAX protease family)
MLSLGAGLYEELLFRVVLVGALGALARRALGLRPAAAGALAVAGGALLFSLAHHVGAYGDPFTLQAFTFRLVAGLFFSALFVLRGFGIAAWTHALYDVGVLVVAR